MIPPREQWCIQIEVTNVCPKQCSNCTRLLRHTNNSFIMDTRTVSKCIEAAKDFPTKSPTSKSAPYKLIGIMGGEPLCHPAFQAVVSRLANVIPKEHRGLWTGLVWQATRHASTIKEVFDLQFVHNNLHTTPCHHSPILVAVQDVIADPTERQQVIDHCWLQQRWASSFSPKGYFFCEVAAAFDWVFDGPGGLPIEPGCWDRPLEDFRSQINEWCPRCGIPLQLKGRLDSEGVDDISQSNLEALQHSPRVQQGKYMLYVPGNQTTTDKPWRYLQ